MVLNNVPGNPGKDDLDDLQNSINEVNNRTSDLENGSSNTVWQSSEPSEADMNSGIVYVWVDADGLLVVGGLENGTKVTTQTQVSVEDPGLVGGIVGGLI